MYFESFALYHCAVPIGASIVADTDGFSDANAAVFSDPDANADVVADADPNSHADADADADLLPFFWLSWPSCTATWCRKLWFNSIRECKPAPRPSRLETSRCSSSHNSKNIFPLTSLRLFASGMSIRGEGGSP